jgi:hypothetical protein
MMNDRTSPYYILCAFNRIENELPELLGNEDWQTHGKSIQSKLEHLRRTNIASDQLSLSMELISEISSSVRARERLNEEIRIQDMIQQELNEELKMQILTRELGVNPEQARASVAVLSYITNWDIRVHENFSSKDKSSTRISLKPGGLDGGTSIKFNNFRLDFGQISTIVGGAFLAGYNAIDKPHPFIIVGSALITIAALVKGMTLQISERETSVFWGFIQARDKDSCASEAEILKLTNKERKNYGLTPLTKMELLNALKKLEAIKSIEPLHNKHQEWRLIEKYKIES